MTSPWGNLCRVCGSPAEYDIFDKIPVYLHASSKDYMHWQSPIYELMQDTIGLRISKDDGLPQHICALCISYLKHAFTFREKAIEICLNFLAVKEYHAILKGETEWNYPKAVNDILAGNNKTSIINDNNTMTRTAPANNVAEENENTAKCFYKDQNKVNKRLITSGQVNDNSNMARVLTNQTKSCLNYLLDLYENPECYERIRGIARQRRQKNVAAASTTAGYFSKKRQNYEDEISRNISSDEYVEHESNGESIAAGGNGEGTGSQKTNNIFTYKEKIFEEDDIMDMDELKDLVNINIESTCKEHKCKYCSRRFMFEETIQEHLKTCVDFKFAEFFEEIKNLMYIKRNKEISPHEFTRRMIFSIRKTCVWLKENLMDTTLPDLLQSNDSAVTEETTEAKRNEERKKSNESKHENIQNCLVESTERRPCPINASNNILHVIGSSTAAKIGQPLHKVNKTVIASSFLQEQPVAAPLRQTPINISNNILHEIERSEMILKKPIAILATSGLNNSMPKISPTATKNHNPERLAFLEKLQNAAKPITLSPLTLGTTTPVQEKVPLISVRQDLMETTTTTTTTTSTRRTHVSPLLDLLQNNTKALNSSTNPLLSTPCARCPTCDLLFETLDALEIHNALKHNAMTASAGNGNGTRASSTGVDPSYVDKEAEHKRIISLFENDDEF
uniref:ZAD domain-containing protein n=1 Tax=Stomoxys calcitrans TaxID=35570 RepID=A0A1I8PM00_STOCA